LTATELYKIEKPSSCMGCPFYNKGRYFTPDHIKPNSEVIFIAQNPGPNEQNGHKLIKRHWFGKDYHDEFKQVQPQPLIGATGKLFNERFLPLSGLNRNEISVANAIRCRPGEAIDNLKADELPSLTNKMKLESSKSDIVKALKHCREAHLKIPKSTKLIVTMGGYSLFQLTGVSDVTQWRGYGFDYSINVAEGNYSTVNPEVYNYLYSDVNIFSTMHIASLFKGDNKKYYHSVLQDFGKIRRLLDGKWPLGLPKWSTTPPSTWPKYSSFDTEYSERKIRIQGMSVLNRWSLCDSENNLYCIEEYNTSPFKIPVEQKSTVLIQNAVTSDDLTHLETITDSLKITVEDLMLFHSVFWTGEPHSLNYMNSIFGGFNRYKHLSRGNPQLYSALDAYEPMYIWRTGFIPEARRDNLSWKAYKELTLPLIKTITKAQQTGAKLDGNRLKQVQHILQCRLDEIKETAKRITGDSNFNIGGSKKIKEEIYGN